MSTEQYESFIAALSDNTPSATEIRDSFSAATSLDQFVLIAKRAGFNVSKLDFLTAMHSQASAKDSGMELYDWFDFDS